MTPTPTVERVAEALRAECLAIFGASWNNDNAARLARVAIEAMREPSEEMVKAVENHPDLYGYGDDSFDWIWRVMIDAALGRGGV